MYSNSTEIYLCLSYSVFVVFQFGFIRSLALCPRWWSLWRRIGQLRCFLILDVRQVTGVSWQTGEAVVTFIRNFVTQTLWLESRWFYVQLNLWKIWLTQNWHPWSFFDICKFITLCIPQWELNIEYIFIRWSKNNISTFWETIYVTVRARSICRYGKRVVQYQQAKVKPSDLTCTNLVYMEVNDNFISKTQCEQFYKVNFLDYNRVV